MATIEKLDSIIASKAAIKAAIQEKGVSCDDTLAEYANRIKAIPNTNIQSDRYEEVSVSSMQDITITPDEGYDAMSEVVVSINVSYTNVERRDFKSVSIAKGVSFNVTLYNPLNGVDLVIINGYEDLNDGETLRIVANIPISEVNKNFILGEVIGMDQPYRKMWLCNYQYNETEKVLTVTVLQQITIEQ